MTSASRQFAAFVAVTFAFTWALLPWARHSILISLVALFGPTVGAVVVTAFDSADARRAFGRRLTDWRHAPRWYLLALTAPVAISALAAVIERLWGAAGPLELAAITPLSLTVFVLVLGEEVGWRGYALPHLQQRHGPWVASVLVGAIWGLWHLPLFHLPEMPQHGSPFLAFVPYTIALSVLLTALAATTRGSVVIATAFHGAVNTFVVANAAATPGESGWGKAVAYGTVAIGVILVLWWRARRRLRGGTT